MIRRSGQKSRRRSASRPRGLARRLGDYALAALLLALAGALAVWIERVEPLQRQGAAVVSDGDSLTVAGQRIRLRGIDAPEYRQTCRKDGADYACGRLAREALVTLIAAGPVSCQGHEHDRYGRLLGDCTAGTVQLNRRLVVDGWAVAYGDFDAEERAARMAGRGIWAGDFERPQDWRRTHDRQHDSGAVHGGQADILTMIGDWLREIFSFP